MKKRVAVILAPVMPVWDEGQFCAPLVTLLVAKGYHVTVIDTLTLIQDASPERAVEALCQALNARFQSSYLLVGFAMAGTLVQLLYPSRHGRKPHVHSTGRICHGVVLVNNQLSGFAFKLCAEISFFH